MKEYYNNLSLVCSSNQGKQKYLPQKTKGNKAQTEIPKAILKRSLSVAAQRTAVLKATVTASEKESSVILLYVHAQVAKIPAKISSSLKIAEGRKKRTPLRLEDATARTPSVQRTIASAS